MRLCVLDMRRVIDVFDSMSHELFEIAQFKVKVRDADPLLNSHSPSTS